MLRLFHVLREVCEVRQRGQQSCSRLPSFRRRTPRPAEDETICCRSSQGADGNPPILSTNQAVEARLIQAHCSLVSSRQHPASLSSVSLDIFGCSVFRSRKFRRAPTCLQLRLEMKVSGHQKRTWLLSGNQILVQEANIPQAVFVGAVQDRCLFDKKNFCVAASTVLQREGFARFPVFGLGEDPGLFLPVALSGKFNVCSTTDCSYYVNSAGSIQCTVKGSPPRIRVCIKENLCAARFE